jgi:hypothetical protein
MMIEDTVIDYAYPCMMAEKAVKNIHAAALHNRIDEAIESATIAISELRLVLAALKITKEEYRG